MTRHGDDPDTVADRSGLPGLALLGPLSLGTQASGVVAIALGQTRQRTLAWISAGTVLWAAVAAGLAAGRMQLLGIGGGAPAVERNLSNGGRCLRWCRPGPTELSSIPHR